MLTYEVKSCYEMEILFMKVKEKVLKEWNMGASLNTMITRLNIQLDSSFIYDSAEASYSHHYVINKVIKHGDIEKKLPKICCSIKYMFNFCQYIILKV